MPKPKKTRRRWSDDLVEAEIRAAASKVGRMPTVSELASEGRNDLSCVISRRGGFRKWAERLGLDLKDCESHRAFEWEMFILERLQQEGFSVEKQSTKAPFDILVAGKIRVNVKSARWHQYGPCKGFFFGIGDTWKRCDLFALVKDQEDPEILWVPSSELQQQTLTLTPRNRINDFNSLELLRNLVAS